MLVEPAEQVTRAISAKGTLPTLANTERPHGEVWHDKTVTCGCQSVFSVDGRVAGAGRAAGRIPLESARPSLAGNHSVSRMLSLAVESASTLRVHASGSMGLALGITTLTSACAASGVCLPVLAEWCPVDIVEHDVAAPLMRCAHHGHGSRTVCFALRLGRDRLSWEQCSSSVCCAGYVGSHGRTSCAGAKTGTDTCGTRLANGYSSSTSCSSHLPTTCSLRARHRRGATLGRVCGQLFSMEFVKKRTKFGQTRTSAEGCGTPTDLPAPFLFNSTVLQPKAVTVR